MAGTNCHTQKYTCAHHGTEKCTSPQMSDEISVYTNAEMLTAHAATMSCVDAFIPDSQTWISFVFWFSIEITSTCRFEARPEEVDVVTS